MVDVHPKVFRADRTSGGLVSLELSGGNGNGKNCKDQNEEQGRMERPIRMSLLHSTAVFIANHALSVHWMIQEIRLAGLFRADYNARAPDDVHRAHNWEEVLSFFRSQGVLHWNRDNDHVSAAGR